jgi:hypothetical protein
MKVHWQPQPKQSEALIRTEDEILFGGSRGGGKSSAGQAWLLYDIGNPRYRALVIRRNAEDLKDWVDRAKQMYAPTKAECIGAVPEFKFPSGAIIRTGHLKDENAFSKYQGHEYQKILIEELTQIPRESDYEKLLGSCRSTVEGIKPQIFATTNPDGPGYKWVKKRWNIPDHPKETILTSVNGRSLVFIPSRLTDNPILMNNDPGYMRYLESIQDKDLKEAWLNGSWAGIRVEGAYYIQQLTEMRATGRTTTVPHQEGVPVHTWWDIGVGDSTAIGFFQQVGREWHIIDYYEASGEGLEHYAQMLVDRSRQENYIYGSHFAPHDIEVRELGTGATRIETARRLGINFKVVKKLSIDDGIAALRRNFSKLWIDKDRCAILIDALGAYRKEWNDKMGEFKSTPLHDWSSHCADMMRYWAVSNQEAERPSSVTVSSQVPTYNSWHKSR